MIFNKIIKTLRLLPLIVPLLMTSCIDLVEEYTFAPDGSGSVSFRLEAPSFAPVLMLAGRYIDSEWKNEIVNIPLQSKEKLSHIPGITEIETITLVKNGKLGFRFHYDKPASLDRALYSLMNMKKKWYYPALIKIKKHRLKRRNLAPDIKRYLYKNQENLKNIDYLKMVDYKVIYHLPRRAVKIKNKDAIKLNDDKTVMQHYNLLTLLNEEVDMGNNIRF